jgi:hypothetical protein
MVQQENWSFSEKTFRSIFQNINSLRKNQLLCDVILKVENEQYYAHRVILSACSDYFCAMFTNEVNQFILIIKYYHFKLNAYCNLDERERFTSNRAPRFK